MRLEVTLYELQVGVPVPLDERHTLVLVANAIVEVIDGEGKPVEGEPVLVRYADGTQERCKTNADGKVLLYGKKKDEVFNVALLGRPKGQQGSAQAIGEERPHALVTVTMPDGTAVANEEVLVERKDGTRETYFTDGAGKVRLFGEPGEDLKVCLVKQVKGTVSSGGASSVPVTNDSDRGVSTPPADGAPADGAPSEAAAESPSASEPPAETGSLALRMLDEETGDVLPSLDVVFKDSSGSELLVVTNDDGYAIVEDLDPGDYTVEPALGEHNPISLTVTVTAGQTTTQDVNLTMIPFLEFDGSRLYWVNGDGSTDTSWPAVSGRPGHHSPSEQHVADVGPLPEGTWDVRQAELQDIEDISTWDRIKSELGRGPWPGTEDSWGRYRVWLHARSGTNTHGRSGFSIHGGEEAGSAGCIDLTGHMDAFADKFRASGRDLVLYVEYR